MPSQLSPAADYPAYNAETNPHLGIPGMACMHGDAQSSDCSPLAGPAASLSQHTNPVNWRPARTAAQTSKRDKLWDVRHIDLGGACPTIMVGSDGIVQVLSTQRFGSGLTFLQPKITLLDPDTGNVLASLEVPKGALLGGVYAYLDAEDRLVFVDGSNTLIRVAHNRTGTELYVDQRISLESLLAGTNGDQVVGVVPDWEGNVWIATEHSRVGVVNWASGRIRALHLTTQAPDEGVHNSISASPAGVSVVTSHAIYFLTAPNGRPEIAWVQPYDRGSARKPGQLSWSSGASPTFFGPTGSDYLMLSDNADGQENLLVFDATSGQPLGSGALFTPGQSGTECSAVGIGSAIVVSSTYGYPYPRYPKGAGESVPRRARFAPGLERWDVHGSGLTSTWRRDDVYCAVVPRYSAADGFIYLCERKPALGLDGAVITGAVIDIATGETVYEQRLPGLITVFGVDTLQMVGTIDSAGTWWQGTIGGVFRISASDA